MNAKIYAVIMAGGMGERFWPLSRRKSPKQLLAIAGKKTMIQETVARLKGVVPNDRVLIITNKAQKQLICGQLPKIPKENIISEPLSRNTAPCIALAARLIQKRSGNDSIMVVLPSDHIIKKTAKFRQAITDSAKVAYDNNVLVTLGIRPCGPHTGYGYINLGKKSRGKFHKVNRFTEKPDLALARKYIRSGKYLWNSGMFVWKTGVILKEINEYVPGILENLKNYKKLPSVSIDYGVMEKTKNAFVCKTDFGWDDVGNWAALEAHLKKDRSGNINKGNSILLNTSRSIVVSNRRLIAVYGMNDIIAVACDDAVLVCPKNKAQNVKDIVSLIKRKYKQYL